MENRKRLGSSDRTRGKQGATTNEVDLANDEMGNNQLQGNDQSHVRNQRRAVPDVNDEAEGVIESFSKTDKDVPARKDTGKSDRTDD